MITYISWRLQTDDVCYRLTQTKATYIYKQVTCLHIHVVLFMTCTLVECFDLKAGRPAGRTAHGQNTYLK